MVSFINKWGVVPHHFMLSSLTQLKLRKNKQQHVGDVEFAIRGRFSYLLLNYNWHNIISVAGVQFRDSTFMYLMKWSPH